MHISVARKHLGINMCKPRKEKYLPHYFFLRSGYLFMYRHFIKILQNCLTEKKLFYDSYHVQTKTLTPKQTDKPNLYIDYFKR